jgi:hypothetical protein
MNQDGKRGHKTKLTGTSPFRRLRSTLEEEEEEKEGRGGGGGRRRRRKKKEEEEEKKKKSRMRHVTHVG